MPARDRVTSPLDACARQTTTLPQPRSSSTTTPTVDLMAAFIMSAPPIAPAIALTAPPRSAVAVGTSANAQRRRSPARR